MASSSSPAVLALRACASLASCYLFASLLPEMRRAQAKRDVGAMPVLPILSMLANCVSWGLYGLLLRDYFPLVATNAVGLALSAFYLVVYYRCTAVKATLRKQVALTLLLLLALVLLVATSSDATRPGVQAAVGYISIALAAVMVGSPLVAVKQVLQTRSAEALPLLMIAAGAVNSALWLAYGVVLNDVVVIAPNVLNLAIGVFQLALVCTFRKRGDYAALDKQQVAQASSHAGVEEAAVSTPQVRPVGEQSSKDQGEEERGIELVVAALTTTGLSPRSRKAANLAAL